ncbi:LLM class flavin-dependent oxidoreductase [Fodinicola acaciae]|uniref:LLM class flavin-dependent oxidoreductase n=1 Tax=Fodinicola acaciae TaxID=2681555 RepID=UPI0013D43F68|nr:LLM class flavin-dependent oxidoreductase [Fodinicola acaciae]
MAKKLKSGLWLPIFDELADPRVVARVAAEAEENGWDGVFVWDHIRWREPVRAVADASITLAAIAAATERVRLGPMVTPVPRRRPVKLARETASLDQLSDGRLIMGVGIGEDRFGAEFSKTGEQLDLRMRGQMLDETLDILTTAWSGETVRHHGDHYTVDEIQFQPSRRIPVWIAAMPRNAKPLRRAARYDGFFPVNLDSADQLAEALAVIQPSESYDVAISVEAGTDPQPYAAAGATWWMTDFNCEAMKLDEVRGVVRDGPVDR